MTSPDRDILISRVVDGTALDHDWAALESLAERDPALWRDLAQSQRQHAALVSVVGAAASAADATDLEIPESQFTGRLSSAARWAGWAVAATVCLAWLGGARTGGTNRASVLPTPDWDRQNPAEALSAYLESGARKGNVLGEMPAKVILQTGPASDNSGRVDVYFLRQIVEKATVDDLYQLSVSSDELGQTGATRVRVRPASGSY